MVAVKGKKFRRKVIKIKIKVKANDNDNEL